MNRKMIAYTIGRILIAEAALMLPSVLVGLIYREPDTWVFAPAIGLLVLAGVLLGRKKPENTVWFCPDCGKQNTGKFCADCGRKKD